jgi:nucleoside-diphosphate-sugar epimerase
MTVLVTGSAGYVGRVVSRGSMMRREPVFAYDRAVSRQLELAWNSHCHYRQCRQRR